ncbi:uncharacterized protein LOC126995145 [Eriocheir sinensis]|uniref:uncharacterized protein LOC126995145 n=1 Tax=Eriocheir sinensis TaxID=95602 RepID=UPI0021C95DC5|nr:uncharacterized protein LOC126995145 [Eriocheir sinensis]
MDKARVTVHEGDGDFDFEEYLRYSLSSSALDGSLPDDQDLMGMNNEIISTQLARSGGYERDLGGIITEMSTRYAQVYESLDLGEGSDDSGTGDDEEGSPMDEAEDGDETEEDDEMDEEEEEKEGDDNDEEMDLNNNVN